MGPDEPESVAWERSGCWEGPDEICPSAGIITNRDKSADDSKEASETGSVANASGRGRRAWWTVIKIMEN